MEILKVNIKLKYICSEVIYVTGKKKQRARFEKENVNDPSKGKLKKFNLSNDEAETKERKEKKRKHEQIEVPQVRI